MRILLFFIALGITTSLNGQQQWRPSLEVYGGFLSPHRTVMSHLPKEHVIGGLFGMEKRLGGRSLFFQKSRTWHDIYKNPTAGLGLVFTSTGNKELIGYGIGPLLYIRFPLTNTSNPLELFSGFGPGFITTPFNRTENYKNVAIGSTTNAMIKVAMLYHYKGLSLGLGVTHFSNGAWSIPNKGINLPHFQVGYSFSRRITPTASEKTKDSIKQIDVPIIATVGAREAYPPLVNRYPSINLLGRVRYQFNPRSRLLVGIDLMNNMSRADRIRLVKPLNSNIQAVQLGLVAGYGQVFSSFTFFFEQGFYLIDIEPVDGRIYHRVGGRYEFDSGLMLQVNLKTHFAKADHGSIGIGYRFTK